MSVLPQQTQDSTEKAIQYIPAWHQQLISTVKQAGNGSSVIPYYVAKEGDAIGAVEALTGISIPASNQDPYRSSISNALSSITLSTGFTFVEVDAPSKSLLDFYYLGSEPAPIPGYAGTDGIALHLENSSGKWATVYWNDSLNIQKSTEYRDTLLLHETGHIFGFSHPLNNGAEPSFNTADTVMSYLPPWYEPGSYLPAQYNEAEVNVLQHFYADVITGLDASTPAFAIDKFKPDTELRPYKAVLPGQSLSDMHEYSDYKKLAKASAGDGRNRIVLKESGVYQALSGRGRDKYIITEQFVDNVTGFVFLSDFDPSRDKFKLSKSLQRDSEALEGFGLGSVGAIPALFNGDNLIALFGLYDSRTPDPSDFAGVNDRALRSFFGDISSSLEHLIS